MINVQVNREWRRFERAARDFGKDAKFAAVVAATRTAKLAQAELVKEMSDVFDQPTRYTLNSTFVRSATKANPRASVGFKEFAGKGTPATRYLMPQVTGGARRPKRFERALQAAGILPKGWYAVPGDSADLDGYGNMSRGQITKILSAVRASSDATQNRSATRKSRGRRRKEQYFAAKPGAPLPPGIYKRGGSNNRDALPVLFFVKRAPQYSRRLPFEQIVRGVASRHLAREFDRALEQAVAATRRRVA